MIIYINLSYLHARTNQQYKKQMFVCILSFVCTGVRSGSDQEEPTSTRNNEENKDRQQAAARTTTANPDANAVDRAVCRPTDRWVLARVRDVFDPCMAKLCCDATHQITIHTNTYVHLDDR